MRVRYTLEFLMVFLLVFALIAGCTSSDAPPAQVGAFYSGEYCNLYTCYPLGIGLLLAEDTIAYPVHLLTSKWIKSSKDAIALVSVVLYDASICRAGG